MSLLKIRARLWNCFYVKIWSFFVNLMYWCRNITKLKSTIHKRNEIKEALKSIDDVKILMSLFKWRKESYDWHPWLITILNEDMKDDCDGSSILGQWAFKCIKIDSDIIFLFNDNSGHAICVTKAKTMFISNNDVIDITDSDWKKFILEYFDNKYTIIID